MNDRTSAVPPMNFIGPEDEAFERRIELHYPGDHQQPQHNGAPADRASTAMDHNRAAFALNGGATHSRPISAAGSFAKKGFWGGLREKFSFSRDKADAPKRPISLDAKFAPGGGGAVAAMSPFATAAGTSSDGKMPSREEIMANYQELMRNGFFDSHAIQSTRQPPPASMMAPPPAPSGPSFASRMAAPQKNWPLPTISSPSATAPSAPGTPDDTPTRGTKRGHSHDDDGDHHGHDINLSFKRLRKSASRISSEMSIPRLRKQRSQQQAAADVAAMPPPPAPLGVTTRRSFSNASKRDTNRLAKRRVNKAAISAPVPLPPDSDGASDIYALSRMSVDSSNAPSFTSYDSSRPGSAYSASTNGSVYTADVAVAVPTPAMAALRVRPDANRGIPSVPRIPVQFKTRPGHAGLENLVAASRPTVGRPWAR